MTENSESIQALQEEIENLKQFKERLKLFEESSFEAITVYDENLICIDTNTRTNTLFQYTRNEVLGMSGLDFFDPEFRDTALKSVQRKNRVPYEAVMRRKDGTTFAAIIQGTTLEINGKNVRVSTCRDITELTQAREEVKQKEDEFQTIFETSPVGIFQVNEHRTIQKANLAAASILGYTSPNDLIGHNIKMIHLSDNSYQKFGDFYKGALIERKEVKFDYQLKQKNGDPVWVNVSGSTVDHSNPPDLKKGVIWCMHDISMRKSNESELLRLSRTDHLTGICNRGHFMDLVNQELAHHRRENKPLALMMLDIDHFKSINDTFGHSMGDNAIRFLTDLCNQVIRESDIFGRMGGEEFAALLLNTDIDRAYKIAERIRIEVEKQSRRQEDIPPMTLSIGLTPIGSSSLSKALDTADKLLYQAKNDGRNKTCVLP